MKKWNLKKLNIWQVGIIVVVILVVVFFLGVYLPIQRYGDTHTWATITVAGEIHSDTDESLIGTEEYLKGDTINVFGVATLKVEDISHDGVVCLRVNQGSLYDDKGEKVTSFVVSREEKGRYKLENGAVTISVDSNRYQ